jgi:uncharacterized protein (DUF608 family)
VHGSLLAHQVKRCQLPAKLFPHAKNVTPKIVLLILNMTPNAVSKFTISLASEYIQTTETTNPKYANILIGQFELICKTNRQFQSKKIKTITKWNRGLSNRSVTKKMNNARQIPNASAIDQTGMTPNRLFNAAWQ